MKKVESCTLNAGDGTGRAPGRQGAQRGEGPAREEWQGIGAADPAALACEGYVARNLARWTREG